jgi:hypothetical protein
LAQDAWILDICSLSEAFYDKFGSLADGQVVLNPTFDGSVDIGGADADLIVDGCLIDIKTVRTTGLQSRWIYQLLGYALLDYSDLYQIRKVALYMSRHAAMLEWPLDELISRLSCKKALPVAKLRNDFRDLLRAGNDGEQAPGETRQSFVEWIHRLRQECNLKTYW